MALRYGDHFEVKVEEKPNNQAYTADGLPLHTDLPFYTQPPGVQLLHSVTAVPPDGGGRSLLADGLAVAHELRRRNPSAYILPPPFRPPASSSPVGALATRLFLDGVSGRHRHPPATTRTL